MRRVGTLLLLLTTSVWVLPRNLRSPEFVRMTQRGFGHIYNLDYGQAEQLFEGLATAHPEHPGPPLYLATISWLEELLRRHELDLDRFAAPGYFVRSTDQVMAAEDRHRFSTHLERSRGLAENILGEKPSHQDARYFLGLSHGIAASFAMTIDRAKDRAFGQGKKAYAYHRDLVEEDPEYYDAYMSVGLYEYIVGSLPWYLKWLAAMVGYRGSRERGIEYLGIAVEKGRYVALDARILQMVLLVFEKDYQQALAGARFLHQKFPRNYLLHLNQAQILEWMGETEQAVAEYGKVVELAEKGRLNYQKLPLGTFRHELGEKLIHLDRQTLALELFLKAIQDPRTPMREVALSHLRAGQIQDLQQRREEAIAHYREVLKRQDVEGAHREAERSLKQPYRADD